MGTIVIYFRLKSVPELRDLPPAERRRVWRHSAQRAFRHWEPWVAWAFVVLPSLALIAVFFLARPAMSKILLLGVPVVLVTQLGEYARRSVVIAYARPYMRRELGIGCPNCGYDLRGIDTGRCPECGQPADHDSSSPTPDGAAGS